MKRRFKFKRGAAESENFVWITFSDLLTTLFMVFMVIALWAISSQDAQKAKGEKCVEDLNVATKSEIETRSALEGLTKKMSSEFVLLQKNGICIDANIEELEGTGGFRIFQKQGLRPWFEDSKSTLSIDAQKCLTGIGSIWVNQINNSKQISYAIKHILIEGHANTNKFPNLSEETNFLKNLELSQARAFQAAAFLIENIHNPIIKNSKSLPLRELLIAQGKSYLEPVRDNSNNEDVERSKRLEFKVVLENKTYGI